MYLALQGCETRAPERISSAGSSIIGGTLDTTHKGVVSLLKFVQLSSGQSGYYPACTGTLLTQNLVLTAHHCVAELSTPDGSVDCGTTNFSPLEDAGSMLISLAADVWTDNQAPYAVKKVWVPSGGNGLCGRDIALLLLEGSGVPASAAKPIEPRLTSEVDDEELFTAIGYGLQDPSDQAGQTAGQRMVATGAQVFCEGTDCGSDLVLDGEFIAESPVCSGDSGGPALDDDGKVCGVTSRGDEACSIGIYSSVSAWRDFIVEKTFEAAESGHYDPPTWAGDPPPGFDPGAGGSGGTASSGGTSHDAGSGGRASGGADAGRGGSVTLAGSGPTAAGTTSMPSGTAGSSSPTIEPLGTQCAGDCPGSYKCWAESGMTTGICVPACSESQSSCPADYSCDTTLKACTKAAPAQAKDDGGCSVSGAGGAGQPAHGWWLGLSLMAFQVARRRAAKPATPRRRA